MKRLSGSSDIQSERRQPADTVRSRCGPILAWRCQISGEGDTDQHHAENQSVSNGNVTACSTAARSQAGCGMCDASPIVHYILIIHTASSEPSSSRCIAAPSCKHCPTHLCLDCIPTRHPRHLSLAEGGSGGKLLVCPPGNAQDTPNAHREDRATTCCWRRRG